MSAAHPPITPEVYHLSIKERLGRGAGSVACGVVAYALRDKMDFQAVNVIDVLEGVTAVLGVALAAETVSGRLLPGLVPGSHPEAE